VASSGPAPTFHVFPVLRAPELDTGLQTGSPTVPLDPRDPSPLWVMRREHIPKKICLHAGTMAQD